MKLPKLRFTWGNIVTMLTTIVGLTKEAAPDLVTVIPGTAPKILAGAAILGMVTKAVATVNHAQIPDEKKSEVGPIVFEKTGPLAPPST